MRNAARTIGAVLDAVLPQAPVVWCVDDASADASADIARAKGARVVVSGRASAAHTRNTGWEAARDAGAEHVLFLDSDAIPVSGWAAALAGRLAKGDADIAGGHVASRPSTRFERAYDRMYEAIDARSFRDGSALLSGATLGVRASLYDTARFDPTLPGALCEDVDFLARAMKAGARAVYVPEAVVHHHHPPNLRAFVRQETRRGRGRAIIVARHPERAGDASVRSWPGWVWDVTVKAPWHLEHARRAAGFDPAVMGLHWLRMAAGHWGYLREAARLNRSRS